MGDTPAFCIHVNTKELLAEGFVSARKQSIVPVGEREEGFVSSRKHRTVKMASGG